MEVITKINNEVLKISVIGELDASGAVNLDHVIQKALDDKLYKIVVDCQQLDYISSAGLGVFISHMADISDHNGKLIFFNMKDSVRHVFDLLGLQHVVTITGNYQEAKTVLYEN